MKVSEFEKLLGKKPENFKEAEIKGFSIDTRKIQEGEMFIAVKTNKNDGHNYVKDAFEKGAIAYLLSSKKVCVNPDLLSNIFIVKNTVLALQKAAQSLATKKIGKSIAITGSAGKTTTKELIYAIIKNYFKTEATSGNYNNTLGVPLSILNTVKDKVDFFVAEFGMSYKGEIKALVEMLRPAYRVWLNVLPAHIGNFKSIEEVKDAKSEILLNPDPETTIIYNADDVLVKSSLDRATGIKFSFGMGENCDLKIEKCETFLDYSMVKLNYLGKEMDFKVKLVGVHNCYNIAAAVLTGLVAGVPLEVIKASVENFEPVENRGVFTLRGKIYLFNDCYNSNPEALKRVISHFSSLEFSGRKVAVIGDMLELGDFSEDLHREIGKILEKSSFDVIITWGKYSSFINEEVKTKENFHFSTEKEVAENINQLIRENDLVVVKASRSMHGEVIIDQILKKWGKR